MGSLNLTELPHQQVKLGLLSCGAWISVGERTLTALPEA
jgi:hypothetical protein